MQGKLLQKIGKRRRKEENLIENHTSFAMV
jgi:hypothetical protein